MDVGLLRPTTLTTVITDVVDISNLIPDTLPLVIAEDTTVVILVEVDIGHKRPSIIPLAILEHELMLKGTVDIGLRPATIHPITQLTVVYC